MKQFRAVSPFTIATPSLDDAVFTAGWAHQSSWPCLSLIRRGSDCSFSSHAQCQATAYGMGADCYGPREEALTARTQLPPLSRDLGKATIEDHRWRHARRHD